MEQNLIKYVYSLNFYSGEATANPNLCPAGTFSNGTGVKSEENCSLCLAGFYCPDQGQVDVYDPCVAGRSINAYQLCCFECSSYSKIVVLTNAVRKLSNGLCVCLVLASQNLLSRKRYAKANKYACSKNVLCNQNG